MKFLNIRAKFPLSAKLRPKSKQIIRSLVQDFLDIDSDRILLFIASCNKRQTRLKKLVHDFPFIKYHLFSTRSFLPKADKAKIRLGLQEINDHSIHLAFKHLSAFRHPLDHFLHCEHVRPLLKIHINLLLITMKHFRVYVLHKRDRKKLPEVL